MTHDSGGLLRRSRGSISSRFTWQTSFGFPHLLFAAPYVLLLFWFHGVDVYRQRFAEPGLITFGYNCFRVLFIFYLFWIVTTSGQLLLHLIARQALDEVGALERIALGFFTGAGVWHIGMFGVGFLGLYTLPFAVGVTLPLVAASYGPARETAGRIYSSLKDGEIASSFGSATLGWITLSAILSVYLLLLFVKGLYPAGGNDYFTHYFYYYQAVIAHRGLWPNEVWYHFFYDKGDGLTFLGILVTDPLAPQLVTFCYMTAALLAIFLASRRVAGATSWPWIATLLFLIIYLYTPGWAEFEKSHELNTALVIGVIWAASESLTRCGEARAKLRRTAAVSAIVAAVITTPTIAMFLCAIFATIFVWYLMTRQLPQAELAFKYGAAAAIILLADCAINYAATGLVNDQALLLLWPFSNLERLEQWGALPMVIKLYWGRIGLGLLQSVPLLKIPKFLIQTSRLDLLFPLSLSASAVALAAFGSRLRQGKWAAPLRAPHQVAILLAAVPAFVALALLAGRAEQTSFYRYASFAVPLMIVAAVGLWSLPLARNGRGFVRLVHDARMPAIVFGLCLISIADSTVPGPLFKTILPRAWRFAVGGISIDTAYTLQIGFPNKPWGAIYPGARGAYAIAGPGTPIWSFHVLSYCMLPGCRMESLESFLLPGWEEAMFGSPEQARSALQASHHNYFLYARDLPFDDYLARGVLFSPDNIAQFLGIRWTDGITSLLTWLGPGVKPLDAEWLANYRRAVEQSPSVQSFPYAQMKRILGELAAMPHPWPAIPLRGNRDPAD